VLSVQSIFGLVVLVGFTWVISEKRKLVSWRDILAGMGLQFALVLILLKIPFFRFFFEILNRAVIMLEESTRAGTTFVFGYLGGGALPFDEKSPGMSFVFGLQALPIVLVVSALSSLLFYWKILPLLVRTFSRLLERTMKIGGAVGLGAAANVFLGMVESPLFVRPYLRKMTRSELFTTMSCGMAGVAGTVMVLYAAILKPIIPDALGHILTVSIITVPGAIMISRIMIPETGEVTSGRITPPAEASGPLDAVARGTVEGVSLLVQIVAMLIVFVSLTHLINLLLSFLPAVSGKALTFQGILGYAMAPLVWLIGIPVDETLAAGSLMGTKTVLNEMIAYMDMAKLPPEALSPHSRLIMTYALCGFANFGSLGIMIGGMGAMVPERRGEIVSLGLKSIISGTLATLIAGAVVGIVAG